jgi:hypothetical protein
MQLQNRFQSSIGLIVGIADAGSFGGLLFLFFLHDRTTPSATRIAGNATSPPTQVALGVSPAEELAFDDCESTLLATELLRAPELLRTI